VREPEGIRLNVYALTSRICALCSLLPALAFAGECESVTTAADLRQAATEVESAWKAMDSERVDAFANRARIVVECLGETLSSEDTASYFRVRGYAEYLAGDIPAAEHSLLAARRIQPRYLIPEDLVAENHPMRKMFLTLAYRPTAVREPLPKPASGVLVVDGTSPATSTPTERPYVFQQIDAAGAVMTSAVFETGARPSYAEYTPPVFVDVVQPNAVGIRRRRTSQTLFIAGLGGVVVGAASMMTSAQLERDWKSRPECADPEVCRGLIRANMAFGIGGIAVTATGAALGVSAVAMGRW
jgi:hypothetical protein